MAAAATTGLVAGNASALEPKAGNHEPVLPTRKPGKTGVEMTLLNRRRVADGDTAPSMALM